MTHCNIELTIPCFKNDSRLPVLSPETPSDPCETHARDRQHDQPQRPLSEDDLADAEQRRVHRDDAREPVRPLHGAAGNWLGTVAETRGDSPPSSAAGPD